MEITPSLLKEYFDLCIQYYTKEFKRMKVLDATDKGGLWSALKVKFPSYQILPDTNYIAYVKGNILASIYTVEKSAQILPTSEKDKEITMQLNIAMEQIWNLSKVGFYQFQAGERAALLNVGITQVGWDDNLTAGSGDTYYKGNVTIKNIDPIKFMRDPFAVDLDTAGYCMTYDDYHKSVFLENPNYKEKFEEYLKTRKYTDTIFTPATDPSRPAQNAKDYFTLVTFWIKEGSSIHEIHTINAEYILYQKENIKPSCFPFAILYCNLPSGSLVGTSECAKIFANNVAYNLMDSIALTAEYKNQRPPKFISSQSGLNIQAFTKYGNEADHTFVVNGRADQAVHYQQFPQPSQIVPQLKMGLEKGIETVSGVDGRYTGRDTGSITTTGGTEEMLGRVTLVDTPKIMTYEDYTKQLTKLILGNFLEYSPKRKYFFKKPNETKWSTVEVNFPKLDSSTLFNYQLDISSELPKNKQRIAQIANMLMEKQMQYGEQGGVNLITEEEWLMFQDLPMKEYMLERMGIQRLQSSVEEVSQVLFQYADLVKNGMSPDDAIMATANSLDQSRKGNMPAEGPVPAVVQESMMGGAPPMM